MRIFLKLIFFINKQNPCIPMPTSTSWTQFENPWSRTQNRLLVSTTCKIPIVPLRICISTIYIKLSTDRAVRAGQRRADKHLSHKRSRSSSQQTCPAGRHYTSLPSFYFFIIIIFHLENVLLGSSILFMVWFAQSFFNHVFKSMRVGDGLSEPWWA